MALRHRERLVLGVLALLASACGGDASGPDDAGGTSIADTLVGRADAPAVAAIPRLLYRPRAEDFAADDPALPGHPISFNTVILVVEPVATVGGINAALRAAGGAIVGGIPGRAGTAPGLLAVRLGTASHAELAPALATLRTAPGVRVATRDAVLRTDAVTRLGAANWAWDFPAATDLGTWGLVAIRMPSAWNLNQHLAAASAEVPVGVLDEGFHLQHEDLAGRIAADTAPRAADHGTLVGGIVAAGFNNGRGTDGVNPFARLVVRAIDFVIRDSQLTAGTATWGLEALVRRHPELVAVNVSVGYNWSADQPPIDTRSNQAARDIANEQGIAVRAALEAIAAGAPLPVIVASAGNDSRVLPDQEARFSSPFANAALEQGVAAIIVVESDSARSAGGTVDFVRSDFSNIGGHLSAPGSRITGPTSSPSGYGSASGTSFAAPLVTGVVSYLYALEPRLPRPTLAVNAVRDLLQASANRGPSRNGRVQLDAFAAVLQLDVLTASDRVLRRLLDVDDGTPDGNRRVDPVTGAVVTTDAPLADGGARIDMADFRRWRDWLLQLEDAPGLALDGDASTNPKRDVNADSLVQPAVGERLFPRGDFNGDGRLSRDPATAVVVPGVLATQGPLTDLQVLRTRFEDANYQQDQLDGLVESGDLDLGLGACLAVPNAASVVVRVLDAGSQALVQQRAVQAGGAAGQVMTIPTGTARNIRVVAEARNAGGAVVANRDTSLSLALGADAAWSPACGQGVNVTVAPAAVTLVQGAAQQFAATVTGSPDPRVTWTATGGSISATGLFVAGGTPGSFTVRATSVADPTRSGTASVTVTAIGNVRFSFVDVGGTEGGEAAGQVTGAEDRSEFDWPSSGTTGSGAAAASTSNTVDILQPDGSFITVSLEATAQLGTTVTTSVSASGGSVTYAATVNAASRINPSVAGPSAIGSASTGLNRALEMEITDGSMRVEATFACSLSAPSGTGSARWAIVQAANGFSVLEGLACAVNQAGGGPTVNQTVIGTLPPGRYRITGGINVSAEGGNGQSTGELGLQLTISPP